MQRPRFSNRHNRRGVIFVVALAVTVVLSAMLLVYAQEMQTEGSISANRLAVAQADAVEQGAEQWVLSQLEANVTPLTGSSTVNATTTVDPTTIPAEALQVGTGYFWLMHADPTQDQNYGFGIVDESSKVNINVATADQLLFLPNMTQEIADSIVAWASTSTGAAASDAATTSYYQGLPDPYQLKNSPFETVEELLLIKDVTPQILYGFDLNHDGVLDTNEQTAANGAAVTNGTTSDSRGLFNYVTAFSTQANANVPGVPGRNPVGLINVNTAPEQVLMTLPGLSQSDAEALITARQGNTTPGGVEWVTTALGQAKARQLTNYITSVSYQYSADIVAVSGDGRAYKRVRIVVDCRTQPAKIIYRRDLTNLGWPLPQEVRDSLRNGKGVPQDVTGTSNVQGQFVILQKRDF